MLYFSFDNIFGLFGVRVFQQTNGIAMSTNWAPLLADLFLHVYEADFLQGLLNNKDSAYAQNNGFLERAQLLMQNLLNQDYRANMLKS